MPLIDLNSMSEAQVREEARWWNIDPVHYTDVKKLKKDIDLQREMRASRHPVYKDDLGQLDANPTEPKERTFGQVTSKSNKNVVDSVKEATVTRPTPGEPENTNKKAAKAQAEAEAADNSVDTQDTNKTDNPGAELEPRGVTEQIQDKKNS